MVIQCCVCKKFRQEDRWLHLDEVVYQGGPISHGYCPECAARAFEAVRMSHGHYVERASSAA